MDFDLWGILEQPSSFLLASINSSNSVKLWLRYLACNVCNVLFVLLHWPFAKCTSARSSNSHIEYVSPHTSLSNHSKRQLRWRELTHVLTALTFILSLIPSWSRACLIKLVEYCWLSARSISLPRLWCSYAFRYWTRSMLPLLLYIHPPNPLNLPTFSVHSHIHIERIIE